MQLFTKLKILILTILLALSLGVFAKNSSYVTQVNTWDQKIDYSTSYEARQRSQEIDRITHAILSTFEIVFSVVFVFYLLRAAWRGLCRSIRRMIRGYDDE